MILSYKNILSNKFKVIINNIKFYSIDSSLQSPIEGRGGHAKILNSKVENLKLQPIDFISSTPLSNSLPSPYPLYDDRGLRATHQKDLVTTEIYTNYILSKKSIKLDSFPLSTSACFINKKGVRGEGAGLASYNVESKLYENILKLSDLLKGREVSLSTYPLNSECKYVPIGNMHMSLTSFKDYFNYSTGGSKASVSNSLIKGFNNKENIYKIRHYLNLLTKFDFKLSNSNYDYFQFKKSNNYLFAMEKAANFLKLAFLAKGCLISRPTFNIVYTLNRLESELSSANLTGLDSSEFGTGALKHPKSTKAKIIIHLFYYIKTKAKVNYPSTLGGDSTGPGNKYITSFYNDKFLFLSDYLTKLFNTEVELDLVRLYQPYQDSNILVQHLNSESYNKKFIKLVSRLFQRINIYKKNKFNKDNVNLPNGQASFPSGISGVNIKLAGRPINERIIPRLTVKRAQRGNFNRLNAKVIEKSMFTDKSRKGAFNFTVTLSHIFR